jgi:hypothetical protein
MGVMQKIRLRLHPVDRTIAALLIVCVVTGSLFHETSDERRLLGIHAALLAGFLLFVGAAARWMNQTWVIYARPLIATAVIFTLYSTVGELGLATMSYRADGLLTGIDTWMCGGVNPAIYLQRWQTAQRVELMAFFYALFIPYINLSLVLGACGRPPVERDNFLTGWIFVYAISYVGYLLAPAPGPADFLAKEFTVQLQGGSFYRAVQDAVSHSGGMVGAFPSLHVGSSLYLCLFDLKTNRLRGLTYVPLVVMIYGATVFLRFHYVIDLVFGTVIAIGCLRLGPWAFGRWARAREAAGLPALPGGEGDVVPRIQDAGGAGSAGFLPAH